MRNQKGVRETLAEINGNHNVLDFMKSKKKAMGIVMDEIDGMNSSDKGGLTELNVCNVFKEKQESSNWFSIYMHFKLN